MRTLMSSQRFRTLIDGGIVQIFVGKMLKVRFARWLSWERGSGLLVLDFTLFGVNLIPSAFWEDAFLLAFARH